MQRLRWALPILILPLLMAAQAVARQVSGCEPAVLAASDGGAFDNFGWSVAVEGDLIVVGANHDDTGGLDAGAAYVFRRVDSVWVQEQKLIASDAQPNWTFGRDVAIDGDALIVGANNSDGMVSGAGSAYVFRYVDNRWIEEQKLVADDGSFGDAFGRACSLCGDTAIIGAAGDDDMGASAGAAYVFRYDGITWVQEQKLLASDGAESDNFGGAVAIAGDWILVGAVDADGLTINSGAVYAFRWNGSAWLEEQKLVADDPGGPVDDHFGSSVSLDGQVALIGDHVDSDVGWSNGSAYVFKYDGEKWIQTQELYLPEPPKDSDNQFGRSVSIQGNGAIVGAPFVSVTGNGDGAAYVYRYDKATDLWLYQEELLPNDIPSTSIFGWSVGISEGTAVIGAYGEFSQSGRAYVFNVAPGSADLDCDGAVGPDDLAELLAQWGACPPPEKGGCSADIAPPDAPDGVVGPADLAELLATWG